LPGEQQEPQSRGPNLAAEYRERAWQLARRFGVLEGVVGVALVGALTLGRADRYSDIDLVVYLRRHTLRTWLLGAAPLPEGESYYHGLRLDLSYRDYADERVREWSAAERWQAARAEILYDPEGLIAELFQRKAVIGDAEQHALLGDEAATASYLLDVAVPAWLYRGDPIGAHHVLNLVVTSIIRLVYLVNQQPVPAEKWLVHLSFELPWQPERWRERLADVLAVREPTNVEASRRLRLLDTLLRECWEQVAPAESRDLAPVEAIQFAMLREVALGGRMPLKEFEERYGLRARLQSPAFDLLWVERHGQDVSVVFHRERLSEIVVHELGRFLDWQQRVLRRLAATL